MKSIKGILIVLTVLYCSSGNTQVIHRNLLMNKYTMADIKQAIVPIEKFKPFPTTPEEWKNQVPDSVLQSIIAEGESGLKFKFNSVSFKSILDFKTKGNRSNYEGESFIKRITLLHLVLAESVEGKGRFMDAVMEGLWSICEESFWGVPAHILSTSGIPDVDKPVADLFTAETATTLGLVNYFVGDELDAVSPLLRKRLIAEINQRFFKPVIENIDNKYGYLKDDVKVNNWCPWIMSNFIASNLLIEKDNSLRSEHLYKALGVINEKLSSVNNKLFESNRIKEDYIGFFFSTNTDFFNRIDRFKLLAEGKIRERNLEGIKYLINNIDTRKEKEDLLRNFDKAFLKIFPNFIEDFNQLFEPEDRIVLLDNEILNTNLRIFALIRMGVHDISKIAQILEYSVNSINTYKTKVKNKSLIPNDKFEQRVMQIQSVNQG